RSRAAGPARGSGPRCRPRPAPRTYAPLRDRLRARPRGGTAAAPRPDLAVSRRGAEGRARTLVAQRPSAPDRPGLARPLPVLHGQHAPDAPALPRPRGGDRRRRAARGEPVFGRDAQPVRGRGGRALDTPPPARRAHVATGVGAERP